MEHRRIIKLGAVVVATHEDGSIDPTGPFSQGLFVGDTRFLSRFRIYLDGLAPSLMGSGEETLYQAGYLQTNPVAASCAGTFFRPRAADGHRERRRDDDPYRPQHGDPPG